MSANRYTYCFIILSLLFFAGSNAVAQKRLLSKEIEIQVDNVPFDSVLQVISYQADLLFSYDASLIPERQRFTLLYQSATVEQVIVQLLKGTGIDYRVMRQQVVFFKIPKEENAKANFSAVKLIGTVIDEAGEPVIGAHVYIANTVKGDATDVYGNFEIKALEIGAYEIVVSHLQHENAYFKISLTGQRDYVHLPIKLEARAVELSDVKISSNNQAYKQNKKDIEQFSKLFLGSTANAAKCEIMNPEVIEVSYDRDHLMMSATSRMPIQIRNEALGYMVNYVLEYMNDNGQVNQLVGFANFEELETDDKRQSKRWIKNREQSYLGSLSHFLRALSDDRLKKEGYYIRLVRQLPNRIDRDRYNVSLHHSLKKRNVMTGRSLRFDYYLEVVYTREKESQNYLLSQGSAGDYHLINSGVADLSYGQISYIKLNLPSATIDQKGRILEPLAITTYGYWAWERVAEAMPFDYEP